jgi:hypothetical protein
MNNVNNACHTSLADIAKAIAHGGPYEDVVRTVCDIISTDPKVDQATLLTIGRLVADAMIAQFAFDRTCEEDAS